MENQTFDHIFGLDINNFDVELHNAITAYAKAIEADNSFEAFEIAQDALYDSVGDHPQFEELEMALGF